MQIEKYGASADLLVINVEHSEGDFVRLGEISYLCYDCYMTFKTLDLVRNLIKTCLEEPKIHKKKHLSFPKTSHLLTTFVISYA